MTDAYPDWAIISCRFCKGTGSCAVGGAPCVCPRCFGQRFVLRTLVPNPHDARYQTITGPRP